MSQQKSILNYFSKVSPSTKSNPNAPSPSPALSQKRERIVQTPPRPQPTPRNPRTVGQVETPKCRPRPSLLQQSQNNEETPPPNKKRAPASSDTSPETPANTKRRKTIPESSSPRKSSHFQHRDGSAIPAARRRYSRIIIHDDDDDEEQEKDQNDASMVVQSDKDEDGEEYKPDEDVTMESEADDSDPSEISVQEISTDNEDEDDYEEKVPKRKGGKKANRNGNVKLPKTPEPTKTPKRATGFKNKLDSSSRYDTPVASPKVKETEKGGGGWSYLQYEFLKEDKIMDKNKRRPNHPEYDHRTLFVPKDFLEDCTPGLRQWWDLKVNSFDSILFFKMGKFYELYHMDAAIAVQELGIVYMKGEHAHCGFPEIAYSQNAEILIERGYKVARCEQTETPAMMEARTKGKRSTKFDRVVRREICQVTTKGIRLASAQDERTMPFNPNSEYLYALVERTQMNVGSGVEYGVCFVDTTIGTFHIGQFKDDRYCSRLRTLFSHHPPVQILHEKGKGSTTLNALLKNMGGVRKDQLVPETEFWSPQKTLKFLAEGDYFRDKESGSVQWPESLSNLLSKSDSLGLTPAEGCDLGLKCLGAVVWYLSYCLVEHDILTLRRFELYAPIDACTLKDEGEIGKRSMAMASKFMVLDGNTLRNLEVTEGAKCLLSFLDNCSTGFGKRLLRYWTCVPLANIEDITRRQDAIQELMGLDDLTNKIIPQMKSLLDLERLLGKIHSFGSIHRSQEHPDSRASFFDEKKYSKRKITDLISVLRSFKTCVSIIHTIEHTGVEFCSQLLSSLISEFPSLDSRLAYFDQAFDHEAAAQAGNIKPVRGKVKEYDAAFEAVEDIMKEADDYLKEVRRTLNVSKIVYFGSDKKRFQLEIPETVNVGDNFDMSGHRKGYNRYTTQRTKALLAKLMAAEVHRENVVKDITRSVFAQFDDSRETWSKAVKCMGTLDALISLTKYSKSQEDMCRPLVVASPRPFIHIESGRHPCLDQAKYIANSCVLGNEDEDEKGGAGTFLLLTGANMGGKSTTMKQTGLIAILAQMGCNVPAKSCTMSLIDRVFTRIGAADNIGEGESTFFVELSETSAILQHSSQASLILMDELGRGTATHDGNAIAFAVAEALSQRGARTIFSTHYHTLVSALKDRPSIQVGHMACMVEREVEDGDDPTQETITFLYKLTGGPCAKSYGFNAARLAGIPDDVIRLAHRKAKDLEASMNKLTLCRKLAAKITASTLTAKDTKLEVI